MKLVIQNASRVWGGNEKWLATLASGIAERGHEVVVSCPPGAVTDGLTQRGIRTSPVRPRGVVDVVGATAFALWLRREQPDAVLMTSWRPITWVASAARFARARKIVLRQGIVRPCPKSGPRALALRRLVDDLIVNSEEIRDVWLRSAPSFGDGRVHVVLNGLDSRRTNRDACRAALRRELRVDQGTLLIGGAGHLFPRKGFDFLLRAFANAGIENARIVIAGDGAHRPVLETLASDLGITDRVYMLGHRDDGPDVIAALDVFVLPSHNEGMANVMLEAMASGVPVIASDISGVRMALGQRDGRPDAGWIVESASDDALANALATVSSLIRSEPELVRERVDEAHWRIQHWFSRDRMVDECAAILFSE